MKISPVFERLSMARGCEIEALDHSASGRPIWETWTVCEPQPNKSACS